MLPTRLPYLFVVGAVVLVPPVTEADSILWYNGDLPSGGGTVNEEASNIGSARVFENFDVTAPGGWLIQSVWSNDSMQFQGVTSAYWSIRSGMSAGNAGTIIGSGTALATQTATGRFNASLLFPEYTIQVSGLSLYLPPGQYWLCVSPVVGSDPISNGTLKSYASVTFGANAIGTPAGNDGGGFLYWPYGGYNYAPSLFNQDYSLGISGITVVPEPSIWALATTAGVFFLLVRLHNRCPDARD